jgi:F0F1-type ATP synthase membrane subunit b/b'
VIVEAEQEVDRLYREALAQAEAEANRTKEESRRAIEAERESARTQLKGQVDQLSSTIINRLLAAVMTLNFNLLETNLVNLAIVIGVLFWFLRGFLGGILERRRSAILQDLQDAEARLKTATEELTKAQSELAAAQQKAEQIRS